MARTILQPNDYAVVSPPGSYLKHYKIPGEKIGTSFPAEIVGRSKGDYIAHKVLTIFTPAENAREMRSHVEVGTYCDSRRFCLTLRELGIDNCRVLVMHVNRPIYFLPFPNDGQEGEVSENWQLEITGGKIKPGEKGAAGGMREAGEESGTKKESLLCYSDAYPGLIANDSGTHAELQRLWYALMVGEPRPPVGREGIVGHDLPTLRELRPLIHSYARRGVVPEVWVPYAVDSLLFGILGGEEVLADKY